MAAPLIVGAAIAVGGMLLKSIAAGLTEAGEKKSLGTQAENARKMITGFQDALDKGEMNLDQILERLDKHFSSMGTEIKDMYKNALDSGISVINSQYEGALQRVGQNIAEAKIMANEQERSHLEQKEKQIKSLEKDFRESNQSIANQAAQNRLSGSGAFIAAIGKSQETLGKVVNELNTSSNNFLRDIGNELQRTIRTGGYQTLEAQRAASEATTGLTSSIAGQQSQSLMNLSNAKFGATEGAYETGLNNQMNLLNLENNANALQGMSDDINPFASVAKGFLGFAGGAAEKTGTDMFGAALSKK